MFDVVFAHALFEHLSDPLKALREVYRVLRPAGIAAISSPDWTGTLVAPPDSAVREVIRRFTQLQQDNQGNPYAGTRLGEWLGAAGFVGMRLSARYDCYENPGLILQLMRERLKGSSQTGEDGCASDESLTRLFAAGEQWSRRPGALFAQAFIEATASVPQ
jgi:SAM-dependent methyltransferase